MLKEILLMTVLSVGISSGRELPGEIRSRGKEAFDHYEKLMAGNFEDLDESGLKKEDIIEIFSQEKDSWLFAFSDLDGDRLPEMFIKKKEGKTAGVFHYDISTASVSCWAWYPSNGIEDITLLDNGELLGITEILGDGYKIENARLFYCMGKNQESGLVELLQHLTVTDINKFKTQFCEPPYDAITECGSYYVNSSQYSVKARIWEDKWGKSDWKYSITVKRIPAEYWYDSSDLERSFDQVRIAANMDSDRKRMRESGNFDNPVDEWYLPLLCGSGEERRTDLLKEYYQVWKKQLEDYLTEFGRQCHYEEDKEMVRTYLTAVQEAEKAQAKLMEYMDMPEEEKIWYKIQTWRCAFHVVRGEATDFEPDDSDKELYYKGLEIMKDIGPWEIYEQCGELNNAIDKETLLVMYDGCEVEIRTRQDSFEASWGNDYVMISELLKENINEEGKQLLEDYLMSCNAWLNAQSNRFWWEPEELNDAVEQGDTLWGNGTRSGINENWGEIYRNYALQMRSMLEDCPEFEYVMGAG